MSKLSLDAGRAMRSMREMRAVRAVHALWCCERLAVVNWDAHCEDPDACGSLLAALG